MMLDNKIQTYDSSDNPFLFLLKNAKPYNPKRRIRKPRPLSAKLRKIARMISKYYDKPGNSVGGMLHVVLDDGNLEKHHILRSLMDAKKAGDTDAVKICKALLSVSYAERQYANGGHDEAVYRWENRKNRKLSKFGFSEADLVPR